MKLPTWLPKVSRPWNPAYGPVWDAMSDNEKRVSFLVDVVIVVVALAFIVNGNQGTRVILLYQISAPSSLAPSHPRCCSMAGLAWMRTYGR